MAGTEYGLVECYTQVCAIVVVIQRLGSRGSGWLARLNIVIHTDMSFSADW